MLGKNHNAFEENEVFWSLPLLRKSYVNYYVSNLVLQNFQRNDLGQEL